MASGSNETGSEAALQCQRGTVDALAGLPVASIVVGIGAQSVP
jgi:hypothetical protein